jgi:alanine racemase
MTGPELLIDLDAFRANVRTLSSLIAPARTMLAVKADAYGHGLLPLARAALESGADSLAVLDVATALAVRAAGIEAPVFAWLHGQDTDFGAAIDAHIDLGISAEWQLASIEQASRDTPARVHLKIDTGLHRNGARPEDWPALVDATVDAERRGGVVLAGIWSHLADASPADDAEALARFHDAIAVARDRGAKPEVLHLAASSAGIREPEARFDLVRFGIAAYGISPFDDATANDLGLRAVMTLTAPVRNVREGEATISVGRADGLQPGAAGRGYVVIRGQRAPILSVDVDSTIVTLDSANPTTVGVGDIATVFGPGDQGEASAETWADWAETIGDEIVAHMNPRVPRRYVDRGLTP